MTKTELKAALLKLQRENFDLRQKMFQPFYPMPVRVNGVMEMHLFHDLDGTHYAPVKPLPKEVTPDPEQQAWLAAIAAHEQAHIAHGHITSEDEQSSEASWEAKRIAGEIALSGRIKWATPRPWFKAADDLPKRKKGKKNKD